MLDRLSRQPEIQYKQSDIMWTAQCLDIHGAIQADYLENQSRHPSGMFRQPDKRPRPSE